MSGCDAHTDEDVIAGDAAAIRQLERADAPAAVDPVDARPEQDRRALRPVQLREPAPQAGAEHPRKRGVQRLDDRHLRAEAERRGRRLEPDEAGADHGEPDARREGARASASASSSVRRARTLS